MSKGSTRITITVDYTLSELRAMFGKRWGLKPGKVTKQDIAEGCKALLQSDLDDIQNEV